MIDYLIRFSLYYKFYLIVGALLLLLILLPTKEKMSPGTKKALYICGALWIICFGYKLTTGRDITRLFESRDSFHYESETKTSEIKGSPFNKYYSNEAGRKPK
jgi:hypothetical protein